MKSRPRASAHSSGLVAHVLVHSCGLAAGVHFIKMYELNLNTNTKNKYFFGTNVKNCAIVA